ncbi:MAG: ISKra4 family transposase, partial [Sedimentisphaerales bacterium]
MDSKILEQLEEAFAEEFELVQQDLGAMEELLKKKMQLLGQGLLQRLVNRNANGYQKSSIACKCGGWMKFIQHRPKYVHTLFGWIRIRRAYYRCPDCGETLFPYDLASGLGCQQISPALAKACCMVAVDDSFEQTSRKIEALTGQKVSDNTIERLVQHVGSVVIKGQANSLQDFCEQRQIPDSENNPERVYIAVDGTTAHEIDGWHEVKVASIYWKNQRGQKDDGRFVASFENSERFGWHLWQQACRCGFRQAKEAVYLGDGAGWIRTEHHRHFGRATFIIDWYHACEHVWDCGKVLFGEGTKATKRWSEQHSSWLWDGRTKRLLDDLKQQCKRHRGRKRQAVDDLYRYISVNEQQMRYDVFRAKGYDISSGSAEGACKNVVGKRLKQSGMIWTRLGSSSVLALRVAWLNEEWEQL